MSQLTVLDIEFNNQGMKNAIYPVVLKDEGEMVLIDCGYPGFFPYVHSAAARKGLDLSRLTKIIITHHDFDHMGALAEFKEKYPHIEVISSPEEAKYISSREKSLRLQQAEALYPSLPEEERKAAKSFERKLAAVKPAQVNRLVYDQEIFPWCGGVEIIATPGHMPGHISVYARQEKALIAGDAMVVENGRLATANPQYTLDMDTARESMRKLLQYDIETVICYHGGIYKDQVKETLHKLLLA